MSAKMNLLIAVVVVATISGYIVSAYIASQPVAEITGEIEAVYLNITTLQINLGNLKPGQTFNRTVSDSDVIVTNFDSRCTVYPTNYDKESDAIDSIEILFKIFDGAIQYNTTFDEDMLINGTAESFNLQAGNWSVEIAVNGKADYPVNSIPVNFNIMVEVNGL